MNSVVLEYLQFTTMSCMRCAARISQLKISDGFKIDTSASLKIKIHLIWVAARAPKIDAILKRKINKGAILDLATWWGSAYPKMGSTEYNCTAVLFKIFTVFLYRGNRYFDRYFFSNLIFSTLHLRKVKSVLYCLESLMHVFFLSSTQRSTSLAKCE